MTALAGNQKVASSTLALGTTFFRFLINIIKIPFFCSFLLLQFQVFWPQLLSSYDWKFEDTILQLDVRYLGIA
jgi:hypothetical protein